MKSQSETGHAKNVANFQDLIEFVTGYGTAYNPSKTSLQLPQLIALKASAETALADVIDTNTSFNAIVNERMIAFSDLKSLSTRVVNALQVTNATEETIKDAKTFNRKMQGKRASAVQVPTNPNAPAPKTISTSQQSYDQLIQHFAGLTAILRSEPSYTPNEAELSIATLQAKIADLTAKNTAVATAYARVSNARIERNNVMYDSSRGLVETALEVKKYVKAVFGASSPQYAQISGIKFKTLKSA